MASLVSDDLMFGLDGNDTLYADDGEDYVYGEDGDDRLEGGGDGDVLNGGSGADKLFGEAGDDDLVGGEGNDELDGGDGYDILEGGAGDDTLSGGQGDGDLDDLYGGAGNDTYQVFTGDGITEITDSDNTGKLLINGQAVGSLQQVAQGANLWRSADGSITAVSTADGIVIRYGTNGSDVVVINGSALTSPTPAASTAAIHRERWRRAGDTLWRGVGEAIEAERATASTASNLSGGFSLLGISFEAADAAAPPPLTNPSSILVGEESERTDGNGHSYYLWPNHNDWAVINATDDQIVRLARDLPATVYGYNGDSQIHGSSFADLLFGDTGDSTGGNAPRENFGDDTLYGYGGNDVMHGWWGSDWLVGGDGDDILYGEKRRTYPEDTLTGGPLTDEEVVLQSPENTHDHLFGDAGNDTLHGDVGRDVLDGGADNDRLYGGAHDDVLLGGSGDDLLFGDVWLRLIDPNSGLPNAGGWRAADVLSAAGNDFLDGGDGNDQMSGGAGNDTLLGGSGRDILFGDGHLKDGSYVEDAHTPAAFTQEGGNDILEGGSGADLLFGGAGDDSLLGGDDADELWGDDAETVWGLAGGPDGNDHLDGGAGDDKLRGEGGDDQLVGGLGQDQLVGGTGSDQLHGGDGNDRLWGGDGRLDGSADGDDRLEGGAGDDFLFGEAGNDTLLGGDGVDQLMGHQGDDVLLGGADNDSLYGDDGNDRLEGGAGVDALVAGAGDDRLEGGRGDDSLWGGDGNDRFVFNLGDGVDTIDDAQGGNTLVLNASSGALSLSFVSGVYTLQYSGSDKIGFSAQTLATLTGVECLDRTLSVGELMHLLPPRIVADGNITLDPAVQAQEIRLQAHNDDLIIVYSGDKQNWIDLLPLLERGVPSYLTMADSMGMSGATGGMPGLQAAMAEASAQQVLVLPNWFRTDPYLYVNTLQLGNGTVDLRSALGMGRTFDGNDYDDVMAGTAYGDVLNGLAGDDELDGLAGDDTLTGGTGDDCLQGGTGNDTYRFALGDGLDRIVEAGGSDTLAFGAGITPEQLEIRDTADGLRIVVRRDGGGAPLDQVLIAAPGHEGDARIETFRFDGGTTLSYADILNRRVGNRAPEVVQNLADLSTPLDAAFSYVIPETAFVDPEGGALNVAVRLANGDALPAWLQYDAATRTLRGTPAVQNAGALQLQIVATDAEGLWALQDLSLQVGEPGNYLIGSDNADVLGGTSADELLYGLNGNDSLSGGNGNDRLTGGLGADTLAGGDGNDSYIYQPGDGYDVIDNHTSRAFNERVDVLSLSGGLLPKDIQLRQMGDDLLLNILGGSYNAGQVRIKDYFLGSSYQLNEIRFSDGSVWTPSTIQALLITGTAGNDTLYGTAAANTLDGQAGNDKLYGRDGNDSLYGSAGMDILYGENGDDALFGGSDSDSLYGGAGNDVLQGEGGNDSLIGGTGTDRYLFQRGGGRDRIYAMDDLTPQDELVFAADIQAGDVSYARTGSDLLLTVAQHGGQLVVSNYFANGGTKGTTLKAIRFADGTAWNYSQLLQGLKTGTTSADTLNGDAGNNGLSGGAGNDVLNGLDGHDVLLGESGNDSLNGGNGDDYLAGGIGSDTLKGGNGANTYVFVPGNGADVIDNSHTDGGDDDRVVFSDGKSNGLMGPGSMQVVRVGNDLQFRFENGTDKLTIKNFFAATGFGNGTIAQFEFTDELVLTREQLLADLRTEGTSGNDIMQGGAGHDWLWGLAGSDKLYGRDGNDDLNGGSGADQLYGEAGDDDLLGGTGNDRLEGGSGSDVYRVYEGDGQDTVYNASTDAGQKDRVELWHGDGAGIGVARSGNNLVLSLIGTTDKLTLVDYFAANGTTTATVDSLMAGEARYTYAAIAAGLAAGATTLAGISPEPALAPIADDAAMAGRDERHAEDRLPPRWGRSEAEFAGAEVAVTGKYTPAGNSWCLPRPVKLPTEMPGAGPGRSRGDEGNFDASGSEVVQLHRLVEAMNGFTGSEGAFEGGYDGGLDRFATPPIIAMPRHTYESI